jgi:hypothetical protein
VTNSIPLGCPLPLTVYTFYDTTTLKVNTLLKATLVTHTLKQKKTLATSLAQYRQTLDPTHKTTRQVRLCLCVSVCLCLWVCVSSLSLSLFCQLIYSSCRFFAHLICCTPLLHVFSHTHIHCSVLSILPPLTCTSHTNTRRTPMPRPMVLHHHQRFVARTVPDWRYCQLLWTPRFVWLLVKAIE